MTEVSADAKFATIESEYGHKTSLPLEDLSEDDVLPAYRLDEEKLPPEHGGPLRIVVPHKYAYKSAKRVRKTKSTQYQELGYWEGAELYLTRSRYLSACSRSSSLFALMSSSV